MISIYFPEEPNIQEKTAVRSFWESLRMVLTTKISDYALNFSCEYFAHNSLFVLKPF